MKTKTSKLPTPTIIKNDSLTKELEKLILEWNKSSSDFFAHAEKAFFSKGKKEEAIVDFEERKEKHMDACGRMIESCTNDLLKVLENHGYEIDFPKGY